MNLTTELLLNLKLTTRINGVMSERNEPAIPAGDDADDMEGIIIKALRFPGVTPVKLSDGIFTVVLSSVYLLLHVKTWRKMIRIGLGRELIPILSKTTQNTLILSLSMLIGFLIGTVFPI